MFELRQKLVDNTVRWIKPWGWNKSLKGVKKIRFGPSLKLVHYLSLGVWVEESNYFNIFIFYLFFTSILTPGAPNAPNAPNCCC